MCQPFGVFDQGIPMYISGGITVANAAKFLVAITDSMNILYIAELKRCVGIVGGILVSISYKIEDMQSRV
jgi:hypothetical protein